jgi:HlyD family secretion protein
MNGRLAVALEESKSIFRKQAFDHLSTPEQLDQLVQVVSRKSWLAIFGIAGGFIVVVVWSIVGRIPVSVEGRGILIHRQQVVSFQSPASGQIVEFNVQVGQHVERDEVIGLINQPELVQRLQQERARLSETQARDVEVLTMQAHRTKLEKQWIERDQARLRRQIDSIRQTANAQFDKSVRYFEQQRENLEAFDELTERLDEIIKERYAFVRALREKEFAPPEEVDAAQWDYFNSQVKLADFRLRSHEVQLFKIEAERQHQRQMNLIAELESDLQELDIRLESITQRQFETESDSALRIKTLEDAVARYDEQLTEKGQIVSRHTGRVIEVSVAVGQFIGVGQRLGAIEIEDDESELVAVAYFSLERGKKIEANMEARVSPSTVQRERYGSIMGTVVEVSSYPVTTDAVTNVLGNAELAKMLTAGKSWIEVVVSLHPDPETPAEFRWTSGTGPDLEITTATTVSVRTTIESRAPISYVIPLLRHGSG